MHGLLLQCWTSSRNKQNQMFQKKGGFLATTENLPLFWRSNHYGSYCINTLANLNSQKVVSWSKNYHEGFLLLQFASKLVETFHKVRSRQNFTSSKTHAHLRFIYRKDKHSEKEQNGIERVLRRFRFVSIRMRSHEKRTTRIKTLGSLKWIKFGWVWWRGMVDGTYLEFLSFRDYSFLPITLL